MRTLKQATDSVLRRLDDERGEVWTRAEVEGFIRDGYDRLARAAECLFDMVGFTSAPLAANHTREWEERFMVGPSFPILGRFNFTREPDREHAGPSAAGPANHTRPSEVGSVTTPSARTLGRLPEGYVSIDRVTHDWLRLDPEHPRYLRRTRNIYKTEQGGAFAYAVDEDGLFSLRTVGVPPPVAPAIEVSGNFGLLRREDPTEDDDDTILGDFGILRSAPLHFPAGGPWGIPRQVIVDDDNTRVELFRLGRPLSEHPFEVPDRFVKYVEFWALHRAYSRAGPGEDRELAEHFRARFQEGVQRLQDRVKAQDQERTTGMGLARTGRRDEYLRHFPTSHGYKTGRRP